MFIIALLWLLIILIFLSIILYVPYNKVTLNYNQTLTPLTATTPGKYSLNIDSELKNTTGYLQITLFISSDRMTFNTNSDRIVLKQGYNTFIVKTPCDIFNLTRKNSPISITENVLLKEVILFYR